jgi:hypothetical protein
MDSVKLLFLHVTKRDGTRLLGFWQGDAQIREAGEMSATSTARPFRVNFGFDQPKFDALVHYICARCDDPSLLGATKLNKILWYSDAIAYLASGHPITGATYVKRQFGPVPRDILASRQRLVARGFLVERQAPFFNYAQIQFITLTPPDLSRFSADEVSIVDRVIEAICRGHSAASISGLTHDQVWEAAEIGEELPIYVILASRAGELTEGDMAWGRSEMLRLEPHRANA